ncbi:URC4/urg3 family protein [Mycolicibacterium monacense]|uniref:Uracil phosphoribosyltransferase n=1 Tax=Mycolicibacterium monacense TaxID=85693 RepID=A0AAD1IZS4_MYCMB|nr:URC4/urg3 family protein [Mycolicibacterium monacense]MDA4103284.1 uracil phosphoribosyltransferase [Mycolicibacterium monacense DSM 44395]OBF56198.1 uracil phosphoribosyltransferase [Mycolicibacterium monacense]ORB12930.1 uracil phosphoribosyltransferase [Mycolicibacterium monacense DSM 44395]QHP88880.1 DUF1688 family protein [Mycolicibacterium monacense DSM 44395]BBZ63659.1 hypothetical protein MMON_49600 [Mycolicibacterium monacense]
MSSDTPEGAAAALRTTDAVRDRAGRLLRRARAGESAWFTVRDDALDSAADVVAEVTRSRYPDLAIPFHSRWRHFEAGDVNRAAGLEGNPRAMIDLAVVSVLLDAGAGPGWSFEEKATGQRFSRSEGLAVASWHAFAGGLFSSDPGDPMRVDADGLRALTADRLGAAFQVCADNPLVGLDGRVELLHRLGDALTAEAFGGRPGGLFDTLTARARTVHAHDILTVLLTELSSIWLSGNDIGDQPLGDCWRHAAVGGEGLTRGWVPFHKLSQWLTYSLLEPFTRAGVPVEGVDTLTGLPEYRNGGLLLDAGVLALRAPEYAERTWEVGDELVVEWRALTVALLDELAPRVSARLGVDMPLACALEGGTWAAGRLLAQQLRGGLPPLTIDSDGTVF